MRRSRHLLRRVFELAFFIFPEKATAFEVACRAIDRLDLTVSKQDKRRYYRPRGRRDFVSMNRAQLLQRLIYVESEAFETSQEESDRDPGPSDEDMIIRFIEYLVRITVRRNALHVVVGLCRLLYRYSSQETADIYSLILQDPDRCPSESYFRSRKAVLLGELRKRFGSMLVEEKGARGEKLIRTREDSDRFAGLVLEALGRFTPWETSCVVPEGFEPSIEDLHSLGCYGQHPDDEHPVEVRRMHALLHPECLAKLARVIGMPAPVGVLSVPTIYMASGGESSGGSGSGLPPDRFQPPGLTPQDDEDLDAYLEEQARLRRRGGMRQLMVAVDGCQVGLVDLESTKQGNFEVVNTFERIDVWGLVGDQKVLLASYLVMAEALEQGGGEVRSIVELGGGRSISFELVPTEVNWQRGIRVGIEYREGGWGQAPARLWRRLVQPRPNLLPLLRPASILMLLLTVSLFWILFPDEITPPSSDSTGRAEGTVASAQAEGESPTRGGLSVRPVESLSEVEFVTIEMTVDPRWQDLRDALVERLGASERFRLSGPDDAEALLRISVGEELVEAEGVVLILLNRAGEPLWGERYKGSPKEVSRLSIEALEQASLRPGQ